MSYVYEIVCVDCGEDLYLGKMVSSDDEQRPIPWQFAGIRGEKQWLRGAELWSLVQHFLIVHRGHELRVMPDNAVQRVDPEYRLVDFDPPESVLDRPIDPEPDEEMEAATMREDIVERLRQRFAALPKKE